MTKVITFSRTFPAYHSRAGQPTFFAQKILNQLNLNTIGEIPDDVKTVFGGVLSFHIVAKAGLKKRHTIRAGNRWNVGDVFSPRVWTGKPYYSKQLQFAPNITIKKVWPFELINGEFYLPGASCTTIIQTIANNDGLTLDDFKEWFNKPFKGQIICWDDQLEY